MAGCFAVFVMLRLAHPQESGRVQVTINFFSPETSINNYSMLKSEFDKYLSAFGNVKFQPFKYRKDFDGFISSGRSDVFLMSPWHFKALSHRERLRPVLVGANHESKSVEARGLWAQKQLGGVESLRGSTVATAGSVDYTLSLLKEMLGGASDDLLSSISLLVVPKDIDALMAVNFGTADAAVATDCAVERLAAVNPQQMNSLKEVARCEPALRPIVVVPAQDFGQMREVISVLTAMGDRPAGRQLLNMIGFEKFQPLEPDQMEELMQ